MEHKSLLVTACLCAALLGAAQIVARAGDLTPPAGPVVETMKTLDEVEPATPIGPDTTPGDATATFIIDQPGVYSFAGPLVGQPNKHGVIITASHVTIDMRGFRFIGPAEQVIGMVVGTAASPVRDVEILNGRFIGWRAGAVNGFNATRLRLRNCAAFAGELAGFSIGDNSEVFDSTVIGLTNAIGGAINARDNCRIVRCTTSDNGATGVSVDDFSSIIDCVSTGNGGEGFRLASAGLIRGGHASGNGADEVVVDGHGNHVDGVTLQHEPDPIGVAGVLVIGERNLIENVGLTVDEPGAVGIHVLGGFRSNRLVRNSILVTQASDGAVGVLLQGGAGGLRNNIILEADNAVGIRLDPSPGLREVCWEEEPNIMARGAGAVGVEIIGASGGIVGGNFGVIGASAIGVDIKAGSDYSVRAAEFTLLETGTVGVRIAAPSSIEQNNLKMLTDNAFGISEAAITHSLIRNNTVETRGTNNVAIGLTTFANSFMTRNLAIGAAGVFATPEGNQYSEVIENPGVDYATDSGANLVIGQ